MESIWVLGAGGHAKVLIDTIRAEGRFCPVGVLDDNPARLGDQVLGVPVLGSITTESIARFSIRQAVIAIGANRIRQAIAHRLDGQVIWGTLVHPRGYVAPDVPVAAGTVVLAGAIVQPGSRVGRHAIINTASSVDHDCTIGDFVHVAPGARVGGNVQLGVGALVGIGATVLSGRNVGTWATLGAGGVAAVDVPDERTAVGVPARLLPTEGRAASVPEAELF